MTRRRPPFRFVGPEPSDDTIKALEDLLVHARQGDLIGLTWTGMFRSRTWAYGATGEARRNPAFALGLIEVQSADLAHQIAGGFVGG